jgi:hypothetical protein
VNGLIFLLSLSLLAPGHKHIPIKELLRGVSALYIDAEVLEKFAPQEELFFFTYCKKKHIDIHVILDGNMTARMEKRRERRTDKLVSSYLFLEMLLGCLESREGKALIVLEGLVGQIKCGRNIASFRQEYMENLNRELNKSL